MEYVKSKAEVNKIMRVRKSGLAVKGIIDNIINLFLVTITSGNVVGTIEWLSLMKGKSNAKKMWEFSALLSTFI